MKTYVGRRILFGALAVGAVVVFLFVLVQYLGDPVSVLLPADASPEQALQLRDSLGLEGPFGLRLLRFLGDLLRADFGRSYFSGADAISLVFARMQPTWLLIIGSVALAFVVGVPLGLLSAVYRNTVFDRITMVLVVFGQAMPIFWTGILFILLFSLRLRLLPTSGYGEPLQMVLPILTLGLFSVARFARVTRASLRPTMSSAWS